MNMSIDGTLIATASSKGTLVRIWSTSSGAQVYELRRGSDKAEIYWLSIDKLNKWLACTSDKGTVHIYSLSNKKKSNK